MKVRFDEVSAELQSVPLDEYPLALEGEEAALSGTLSLHRRGEEEVFLRGYAEALILLPCSRCAEEAQWHFSADFEYRIFPGAEPEKPAEEQESSVEDLDLLYLDTEEIDLDEILREQVYLNMPQQLLCAPECKGRCSGCGVDLNRTACTCTEESSSSPFAVLSKLKR